MSGLDNLHTKIAQLQALAALGPDETEEEVDADIQRRFGHLSERQLREMILNAVKREAKHLVEYYESGALASPEHKQRVEEAKRKLTQGGFTLDLNRESDGFAVYVDGKRTAWGQPTAKQALMYAAAVYLS